MTLLEGQLQQYLDTCHAAGIRDPFQLLLNRKLRIYSYLDGAFPRGILPTDIDGEVEINGHFLRFEFKHENCLKSGKLPEGQLRYYEALVRLGKFTIFYVGHDDRHDPTLLQQWNENGKKYPPHPCDYKRLYEACERWSSFAEGIPFLSTQIVAYQEPNGVDHSLVNGNGKLHRAEQFNFNL